MIIVGAACTLHGAKAEPNFLYYSHDMELVEVRLANRRQGQFIGGHVLHLPRAMIAFADGYRRPERETLPSKLITKTLRVKFVYPGGEPLSIAVREYAEANKFPVNKSQAIDLDDFSVELK